LRPRKKEKRGGCFFFGGQPKKEQAGAFFLVFFKFKGLKLKKGQGPHLKTRKKSGRKKKH